MVTCEFLASHFFLAWEVGLVGPVGLVGRIWGLRIVSDSSDVLGKSDEFWSGEKIRKRGLRSEVQPPL